MKITKDMKVGDIYLNPLAEDLWILRKDYTEDYDNEQWVLSLVHTDYVVKYIEVDKFIKLGNIYEVFERIDSAIEYINHYETIRGYYGYEECGYDEYNYEEDLKEELLNILKESGE